MLDLPPDSEGLDFVAASEPQELLLIPGLLPASITAAALGDQQAAAYLRFTAQHFAAFRPPDTDELQIFCQASALPTSQSGGSVLQAEVFKRRKRHTTNLLWSAARAGKLAELKWLRAMCQPTAYVDGVLMETAAEEGHLAILQHLRTGPNPAPWGDASEYAVQHAECLRWLLDSGCPCLDETLPGLARRCDMETLKWIYTHPRAPVFMSLWNEEVTAAAARSGSLTLLQWLRAPPLSVPWDSACTAQAACKGDLPMLQWLRAEDPPCPWNAECFTNAASGRSLPLLQWLRSQGAPWNEALCTMAASKGNIDVLSWARSQPDPCPWNCRAMWAAAFKPSMECLQWLHAHGAPWDASCCVAAARHDLSILRWLRSHVSPCPFDARVSDQAARQGDLAKLRWLHDEGCPIAGTAYLRAAWGISLIRPGKHVLRWLHERGVPAPPEPLPGYFKNMQTLLFMADKGFPLEREHHQLVNAARRSFCTFHGLLRWCRRAVSDPSCGAHRAFDFFAARNAGQNLLVRLSQLPPELVTRIAVAADLQQDIM